MASSSIFNEFTHQQTTNSLTAWSTFYTIKKQTYSSWKIYATKIWMKLHVCASISHYYKQMITQPCRLTASSRFPSSSLYAKQPFKIWTPIGNLKTTARVTRASHCSFPERTVRYRYSSRCDAGSRDSLFFAASHLESAPTVLHLLHIQQWVSKNIQSPWPFSSPTKKKIR